MKHHYNVFLLVLALCVAIVFYRFLGTPELESLS